MTEVTELRAAVVGTGFIGVVHVDALRRLGVEVVGVVGSTPERAAAKGLAPAYSSYEAMLEDERVDVSTRPEPGLEGVRAHLDDLVARGIQP